MTSIKDSFGQRGYNIHMACEQLLLKAAGEDVYNDEFHTATSFYCCEFNPRELETHLSTFTHNIPRVVNVTLSNMLAYL